MVFNNKKLFCISGLPRSGSTLLSAILNQNPLIHSEGNSGLCQLMWDLHYSIKINSAEQLAANDKTHIDKPLMNYLYHKYYENVLESETIIFDKSRAWTIPDNLALIQNYIFPEVKVIVLERSIIDIMKSFGRLIDNEFSPINLHKILSPNSEPLIRSLISLQYIKKNNQNNTFLFINYDALVSKPKETIDNIYKFLQIEYYNHDFENISNKYNEKDEIYLVKDFHKIRPTVKKIENSYELPLDILQIAEELEKYRNSI